jgi:hypothetical protein
MSESVIWMEGAKKLHGGTLDQLIEVVFTNGALSNHGMHDLMSAAHLLTELASSELFQLDNGRAATEGHLIS